MARFTVGLLFAVRLLSPAAISAQPLPNGPTLLSGETESATRSWARPAMPEPDDGATDAWQDAPTAPCAGEHADEPVATDDAVEAVALAVTEDAVEAFAPAMTDGAVDEEETTSSNAPRDAGEVTAMERRQVRPAIGDAGQENVQTPLDVPDYAPQDVPTLIADAAQRWGLDSRQMLRVAWCESRWNPGAQSRAGAAGVFQFIPSTWRLASAAVNMSYASPYDPVANIEAASWLMATQGPRHWTCR
ncbi:MAG: lytic transglycosylase domain-containing protein [Chloroflexota bacterium]|nr:lytic transglycosylase domain-containing protein [Chloroflexota bacterium]